MILEREAPDAPWPWLISILIKSYGFNSKGHFFSVMFKKKTDKTTRNISCQYVVGQKRSGNIIKVKESGLLKKGLNPIRSFDYTTIQELRMNKTTYSVK